MFNKQWWLLVRHKEWQQFLGLFSSVTLFVSHTASSCQTSLLIFLLPVSWPLCDLEMTSNIKVYFLFVCFSIQTSELSGCSCPEGFHGNGHNCDGFHLYPFRFTNQYDQWICQTISSKITFLKCQILTNAKKVQSASAPAAAVRIHGVDMIVSVEEIACISRTKTLV